MIFISFEEVKLSVAVNLFLKPQFCKKSSFNRKKPLNRLFTFIDAAGHLKHSVSEWNLSKSKTFIQTRSLKDNLSQIFSSVALFVLQCDSLLKFSRTLAWRDHIQKDVCLVIYTFYSLHSLAFHTFLIYICIGKK